MEESHHVSSRLVEIDIPHHRFCGTQLAWLFSAGKFGGTVYSLWSTVSTVPVCLLKTSTLFRITYVVSCHFPKFLVHKICCCTQKAVGRAAEVAHARDISDTPHQGSFQSLRSSYHSLATTPQPCHISSALPHIHSDAKLSTMATTTTYQYKPLESNRHIRLLDIHGLNVARLLRK